MEVGAIVILDENDGSVGSASDSSLYEVEKRLTDGPLAFVELLGQSLLEREIEQFVSANARATTVLVHSSIAGSMPAFRRPIANLAIRVADDMWSALTQILRSYSEDGMDCALVSAARAYAEPDFDELLDFHVHGGRSVTRISDGDGPLDLWIVDCDAEGQKGTAGLKSALTDPVFYPASYFLTGYAKRVKDAEDCRELVVDALLSHCNLRPIGQQLRPGVWADVGTQIRRGARVVGPAYLGRRCVIGESALITRCSNIERCSYIDYGTAIEDSSVLSNTYVGMWLDVRHSVVHGNKLLNMERGVMIEISDPSLLRSSVAGSKVSRAPFVDMPETLHARRSLAACESYNNRVQSVNTTTEFES